MLVVLEFWEARESGPVKLPAVPLVASSPPDEAGSPRRFLPASHQRAESERPEPAPRKALHRPRMEWVELEVPPRTSRKSLAKSLLLKQCSQAVPSLGPGPAEIVSASLRAGQSWTNSWPPTPLRQRPLAKERRKSPFRLLGPIIIEVGSLALNLAPIVKWTLY